MPATRIPTSSFIRATGDDREQLAFTRLLAKTIKAGKINSIFFKFNDQAYSLTLKSGRDIPDQDGNYYPQHFTTPHYGFSEEEYL